MGKGTSGISYCLYCCGRCLVWTQMNVAFVSDGFKSVYISRRLVQRQAHAILCHRSFNIGKTNSFTEFKFQGKCKTFNNSFSSFYRMIMWQSSFQHCLVLFFYFLSLYRTGGGEWEEQENGEGKRDMKNEISSVKKHKLRKKRILHCLGIKPTLALWCLHLYSLSQQFFKRQLYISENCC